MTRQKVDLTKMFNVATEMSATEAENAQLQAEIERLRASQAPELETQLVALREQLKVQSGVQEISVIAIQPNPVQPRKTFSQPSLDLMARTLIKDGQLHPIIVIPEGERFDLLDGERRWRAAKQLGWETIKAVSVPRPNDLHRKALLTTLHREDLNPLDKAEALLKEISEQTGIAPEEAPRILSTVVRRLDYQKRMKQVGNLVTASEDGQKLGLEAFSLAEQEKSILKVLLDLGLHPASVAANDFRILSLFPDLQLAIRTVNLKASHAMVLQRLSDKKLAMDEKRVAKLRSEATQKVVEHDLTLAETQELVNQIIEKHISKQVSSSNDKLVKNVVRDLKKLGFDGMDRSKLENLRQSLQQKLQELEAALEVNPD